MNNYKSQGQTFEEALVNLSEDGIFVEDPFFKQHMENIRKQREPGLEFDMDQVYATHGAITEEQKRSMGEKIDNLPLTLVDDEAEIQDSDSFFKILKGRTPTGRFDHPFIPHMHSLPGLKDGDAFICMEEGLGWKRLEQYCAEGVRRPDVHISGEDPALKIRKHPMIFKVTDLAEDKEEFPRLKSTLERNQQVEDVLGWPAPPMFIEAIPDANVVSRSMDEVMKELTALARQYKVEIYFGTKPALKTALYSLMYGAKKKDLDMSQLDEISVEKAAEMYEESRRKVAIIGGGGMSDLVQRIIAEQHGLTVSVDSFDTWNFKDFANIAKLDKPARDWEHTKLRRGKGHNKFKRKGKK